MNQTRFDDLAGGERLEVALELSERHAEPGALDRAVEIVHGLAERQPTLTAADVTEAVRRAGIELHEPRAIANALLRARARGWISATSEFVRCDRPERNAGMQRVWVSRLYR